MPRDLEALSCWRDRSLIFYIFVKEMVSQKDWARKPWVTVY